MGDGVLVVGAGGFIGRHLVQALADRSQPVIAASRTPFDATAAGVEAIGLDANDDAALLALVERARVVVHVASASTPGSSAHRPLDELGNIRLTLALLGALQRQPGASLLYVSSGGTLYGDTPVGAARETSPLHPKSYYAAGKAAAEEFIAAWCNQSGGAATILRPSNVYGPGQGERRGFGIVPCAMGKLRRGEALTIWGDGSAERDYLYIDDFIALCLAVLDAPMPAGVRVFNAASGRDVPLSGLLDAIEAAVGRKLARAHAARRDVDVARIALDPSAARAAFGWSAATPLDEGLRRTWAWFDSTPH